VRFQPYRYDLFLGFTELDSAIYELAICFQMPFSTGPVAAKAEWHVVRLYIFASCANAPVAVQA